MNAVPIGSGVVVHDRRRVPSNCSTRSSGGGFQPLVRRNSQWSSEQWETVRTSERTDIAVLRASPAKLSGLTPEYGFKHLLIGAVGPAMGFPALTNPQEISHIGEMHGLPIPLTTLVFAYFRPGTDATAGIHYAGGYVNAVFSGGAMLLPTTEGWTIAGIIMHREGVQRQANLRKTAISHIRSRRA